MKRRILLNFSHYITPKDPGGLRSWHIGTHLALKGYSVVAIIPGVDTLTGKKRGNLKGKCWTKEVIDGVEVFWVNSFKNDRNSKIRRALYYLSFSILQAVVSVLVRRIDGIVCMSIPFTSVCYSYIQSIIRRVPVIVDVRDLPIDTAIELGYLKRNMLTNNILKAERWLYKHADKLIAVSEGWESRLKEKGVSPSKINVVPLGFEGRGIYGKYIDWNRDIKAELDLKNKFVVAYVGTLGHVFDIAAVLNAAKRTSHIKRIVYLFAGGGQRLEEFSQIALENDLNCIFLGPRPKSDVPLICSQVDVCICPYKKGKYVASILGNKIFDYMGNGTATVYSGPKGDVSKILEESNGGICVPAGDSIGIAEAIIFLYKNPDNLQLLGVNAKNHIEKSYNVRNMMLRFEKTIYNLL